MTTNANMDVRVGRLIRHLWKCKRYNHYGNQLEVCQKAKIYHMIQLYHSWVCTQRTLYPTTVVVRVKSKNAAGPQVAAGP